MNYLNVNRASITCLVIEEQSKMKDVADSLHINDRFYDFQFCSDYQRALTILSKDTIDLILLTNFTVESNALNAYQFFQQIKSHYPVILLVDAHDTLGKYSFEHENIIDCILKPIDQDRLQLAFHKFQRYSHASATIQTNDSVFIKMGRILRKFHVSDIMYIQATGALSTVYTPSNTFVVNETITQLENRLPKAKFSRIHKSYLVGLDHVVGYEKRNALLQDTKIPIGATYRDKLESIFSLFNT